MIGGLFLVDTEGASRSMVNPRHGSFSSVVSCVWKQTNKNTGKFPGSLEEMLAFVSYLPLCGNGRVRGDGIIPCDIATLDGSTMVELPTSKHSGEPFSLLCKG